MNIIDMHCDTMYQIYERKREGKTIAVRDDANLHVTLEKMKQGGYLLQNFAAFVELEESKEQLANEVEDIKLAPYQFARHLIDKFKDTNRGKPGSDRRCPFLCRYSEQ